MTAHGLHIMNPMLANTPNASAPQLADLDALVMPSSAATPALAPATDLQSLSASTQGLREIAKSATPEEMDFFKFQVSRHQSSVDVSASQSYMEGTLPAPQALLSRAA